MHGMLDFGKGSAIVLASSNVGDDDAYSGESENVARKRCSGLRYMRWPASAKKMCTTVRSYDALLYRHIYQRTW